MSTRPNPDHYRAAIIGLGEMGSSNEFIGSKYGHLRTVYGRLSHAAAFYDHPRVRLIAHRGEILDGVLDSKAGGALRMCTQIGEKLLEREQLDILSVCTNTPSHAEIVIQAAKCGVKAIFLPKNPLPHVSRMQTQWSKRAKTGA